MVLQVHPMAIYAKIKPIKDEQWVKEMDEEIDSIKRNETWDLVDFPKDKMHWSEMGL